MKSKRIASLVFLAFLLTSCCTTSTTTSGCYGHTTRSYSQTCRSYWPQEDSCQCANQMCGRIPCLSKAKCCSAFGNIGASSYQETDRYTDDDDVYYAPPPISYK